MALIRRNYVSSYESLWDEELYGAGCVVRDALEDWFHDVSNAIIAAQGRPLTFAEFRSMRPRTWEEMFGDGGYYDWRRTGRHAETPDHEINDEAR